PVFGHFPFLHHPIAGTVFLSGDEVNTSVGPPGKERIIGVTPIDSQDRTVSPSFSSLFPADGKRHVLPPPCFKKQGYLTLFPLTKLSISRYYKSKILNLKFLTMRMEFGFGQTKERPD
ncbi:MAG: hypothetical protein NTX88_00380, partial [Candidatus Atribacteria bacterium]|nr:hypothetical protein [Candidatus Atribacteria bacterium]